MIKDKIAYLRVSTWKGRAPYASHYYGEITLGRFFFEEEDGYKSAEVKRRLTDGEATDLNNMELLQRGHNDFNWKKGENCKHFLTEESLIRAAKKIFKKEFVPVGAKALVVGNRSLEEPQLVACVSSPELRSLMRKINVYAAKLKELDALCDEDDYRPHHDIINTIQDGIDAIVKEWHPLFEELKK